MAAPDLVEEAVRFGRRLRAEGLAVTPEREARFVRALALVGASRPDDVYWAGRLCLVSDPAGIAAYDRVFATFWRAPASGAKRRGDGDGVAPAAPATPPGADGAASARAAGLRRTPTGASVAGREGDERLLPGLERWRRQSAQTLTDASTAGGDRPAQADEDDEGEIRHGLYSARERLGDKDFASLGENDLATLRRTLRPPWPWRPERRARRLRGARRGAALDLPRTLAAAARSAGEPLAPRWRGRRRRFRRWVILCDLSASMAPYARGALVVLQAVVAHRPQTEAFVFATRLTRLTARVRRAPHAPVGDLLAAVGDAGGGTQIGAALRALRREWGRRGLVHGAVLVVVSDGLDLGDTALVASELQRLARLAERIVWVNPLSRSPRYEPLALAMAAAMPYVDELTTGHCANALLTLFARQARRDARALGRWEVDG